MLRALRSQNRRARAIYRPRSRLRPLTRRPPGQLLRPADPVDPTEPAGDSEGTIRGPIDDEPELPEQTEATPESTADPEPTPEMTAPTATTSKPAPPATERDTGADGGSAPSERRSAHSSRTASTGTKNIEPPTDIAERVQVRTEKAPAQDTSPSSVASLTNTASSSPAPTAIVTDLKSAAATPAETTPATAPDPAAPTRGANAH